MRRLLTAVAALLVLIASAPESAQAQATNQIPDAFVDGLATRSIGPSHMGGRITDIEGVASDPNTVYVATSLSGVWKTTNGGVNFFPLFQNERVISLGDMAIAPSNPDILYLGTGEEDSRNSIAPGGGLYKSTDGGLTWELKGLEETQQIGQVIVHPNDPNTVWVAALGAAWGTNPERGIYKTTDGGDSWELKKFISDEAGFVDMEIHPTNPDILFASSWQRIRKAWYFKSGGTGSGLWKSTDGGETWNEVQGGGFPETELGRIGIAIAPSNGNVMYTIVEAAPEGLTADDYLAGRVSEQQGWVTRIGDEEFEPGEGPRRLSGIYRSTDGGQTWEWMNTQNNRPFYYSRIWVDPADEDRVYMLATRMSFSTDGGRTWAGAANGHHVDFHAMWIDPNDPKTFWVGSDGGVARTFDHGGNYEVLNQYAMGHFYDISFDMAVPYRVCGGLQDNGSWCGPSRKANGQLVDTDWFNVGGGDGFVTEQHLENPNIIYSESQGGSMSRRDLGAGGGRGGGRGSGLRPQGVQERWNWNTPFFLSPHNQDVFYAGASRVYKKTGPNAPTVAISPDLTTQNAEKIRLSTQTTGGITPDVTQAETNNTIVSLAESPITPGLLYAGTDDGNVWVTRNDGGEWTDLTANIAGVPSELWVSHVEPSSHEEGRVYVSIDGHWDNDFRPYVFVSDDFGATFRSISSNLPTDRPMHIHVVREDPVNEDLVYVGTDTGIYFSIDRGASWKHLTAGLPTSPMHDLEIHPRDREMVVGTHGRSIWIVDVAPLQGLTADVMAQAGHVFEGPTAFRFSQLPGGEGTDGHQGWRGDNDQSGADIYYWIAQDQQRSNVSLVISDAAGNPLAVDVPGEGDIVDAGLYRYVWNFSGLPEGTVVDDLVQQQLAGGGGGGGRGGGNVDVPGYPPGYNPRPGEGQVSTQGDPNAGPPQAGGGGRGGRGGGGGRGGRGGFGGGGFIQPVPGEYLVTLNVGDQSFTQKVRWADLGLVMPTQVWDENGRPGGR